MLIYINTRVLQSEVTGVQRYILELIDRLPNKLKLVEPKWGHMGVTGHAWEQLVLPRLVSDNVLFSPSNTGPLAATRQVVTIHDVVPLDHHDWLNPRFAAWYQFLTPFLAKRVAHVITISEFNKERILSHIPMNENRITVIPNGVDTRFRPLTQTAAWKKLDPLQLPSRQYILCVGSLEPRKNLARLLQAWARISKNIPKDIWLVLAGKHGATRVFSKSAVLDKLPSRVHSTGHVSERILPALYAGALAFAYPSLYEGFGLPPLEAMATGIPVLTGNRTSLPEVVGDAGLMVDPYDVDAIAEGLERLIEDSTLRASLRVKGLERAKEFNWDVTAKKTWDLLREAAKG